MSCRSENVVRLCRRLYPGCAALLVARALVANRQSEDGIMGA